jgi:hypothetical protein
MWGMILLVGLSLSSSETILVIAGTAIPTTPFYPITKPASTRKFLSKLRFLEIKVS